MQSADIPEVSGHIFFLAAITISFPRVRGGEALRSGKRLKNPNMIQNKKIKKKQNMMNKLYTLKY